MKCSTYSLLAALLLVTVVGSHGGDASAPPDVTGTPGSSLGWEKKAMSCLMQGNGTVCVIDSAYTAAEKWLSTAPEFKAAAVAEMNGKGEKGLLDNVGGVTVSTVGRFVKFLIDSDGEDSDSGVEGRGGYGGGIPNAVVQVGTQGQFGGIGYPHRLRTLKTKKKALIKFYVLAKLFIYGFIAKAKIGLIMFKILLLVKLKFLALAVIHTLIAFAKLHFQIKTHHIPQKVLFSGHEQQHQHQHGNYQQHNYGGSYGGGGGGGGGGVMYGGEESYGGW